MMKRTGVPRMGLDDPGSLPSQNAPQMQQPGGSNMHVLAQSAQPQILGGTALLTSSVSGGPVPGAGCAGAAGFGRAPRPASPHVINYLKSGVQYAAHKPQPLPMPMRVKDESIFRQQPLSVTPPAATVSVPPPVGPGPPGPNPAGPVPPGGPAPQFQRLKVEDALSYLDQVKFKFNTQPQVYNDFLDIMKEFKSQTIDTPGVITRVSNLFKGHPALIVGFNTFLPPGYKIEVQSDGQVSVSMPSPTGLGAAGSVLLGVHHPQPQPQLVHLLPVAQSVSTAIVHKLSAPPPTTTLHHISTTHRQIENTTVHHVQSPVQPPPVSHAPATGGQPVEFNHAIEYVNKIKSRFSRQPDKYKRFLEILHAYQRTHRDVKEKHHTEQEVYSQVAKLFENQDDLLAEFGQFLPDAKGVGKGASPAGTPPLDHVQVLSQCNSLQQHIEAEQERYAAITPVEATQEHPQQQPPGPELVSNVPPRLPLPLKRSPSFSSGTHMSGAPLAKRPRSALTGARVRDVSYAEAAKLATLHDYTLFDRVRKALRYHHVYDNFLRCLLLYTNEIISGSELVSVTQPFLARQPELQRALRRLLRAASPSQTPQGYNSSNTFGSVSTSNVPYERDKRFEPIGPLGAQLRHERPQGDVAMDIDLNTCKRLGASYVALPREAAARKCSGRTQLCKEVLNDTWVSFPTWSEDSTFVTSRKTQYEEYIYRCEDERFELDVVIETNASTIRVLEGVQKKLSRMSTDDAASYRLDDCLGGQSATIHQRALRRIYGDKAVDIIAGLKKNPVVAVPVVLRRLKAKEEEWRDAQKGFNKQWREQNEKYYLKSLDHQGINFKQNDLKAMRSKSLFNEVESAYAAGKPGPHLVVDYNTHSRQEAIKILQDTAELLIHHARRQTAIQKAEKRRIKQLLRQFLPDLFAHPRQPLSDDERDEEDKESPASEASEGDPARDDSIKQEKHESSESDNASEKSARNNKNDKENKPKNNNTDSSKENLNSLSNSVKRSSSNEEVPIKNEFKSDMDLEEDYREYPSNEARFVCSSSWYVFFRVHAAICQRLCAARRHAMSPGLPAPPPHATNLPLDVRSPSDYYTALLELVRGVLDGNVEASSYEDAAREMFGIKAYPVYTLDKLVSIAVRQLQHCVSEPWSSRCTELCQRGMRGPLAYVRRAARALRPDHAAFMLHVYGGDTCRVTFQLLESSSQSSHSHSHKGNSTRPVRAYNKPVFLRRNVSIELHARDNNAATAPAAIPRPAQRKPSSAIGYRRRAVMAPLYRVGCLRAARAAQAACSRQRSARFQVWLANKRRHPLQHT